MVVTDVKVVVLDVMVLAHMNVMVVGMRDQRDRHGDGYGGGSYVGYGDGSYGSDGGGRYVGSFLLHFFLFFYV